MSQSSLPRVLPNSRLRMVVAGVVLVACIAGIFALAADVLRQIDQGASSRSDRATWALSQVEVELARFILATESVIAGKAPLAETRLRFDVFFSRMTTLSEGKVFARLRQLPDFQASFGRLQAFVTTTTPIIDGPNDALRAQMPDISHNARILLAETRALAITGLSLFAEISDNERKTTRETLILAFFLSFALVVALAWLLFATLRLYQYNQARAAENLETLARLDAVVSAASEALITVDQYGRVIDFNQAACTTFGFTKREVLRRNLASLITAPRIAAAFVNSAAVAGAFEDPGRLRIVAWHKDGHSFPAEATISRTMSGGQVVFAIFLRDLTAQLAAEDDLRAARDKALAGEKAKADLLVVMSHEIRTPLNGMIGTIQLLEATDLQPDQREYLRIMDASGTLLMHHVNDVLNIARLDSGRAEFAQRPVNLSVLIQEVLENQMPASRTNGNDMFYVPPQDGRDIVMCDGAQMTQVLLNLVGNAVKFTRNGVISVEVSHLGSDGPTEIRVIDSGIGIPKDDLGRIFDDFVTLDTTYARRSSGTGLGLGIVKRIVELMGGDLTVESLPDKGSAFCVRLPLTILPLQPATDDSMPQAASTLLRTGRMSVLVVEDNDFNRFIVKEMLIKDGHDVVEAKDGDEGIARARERVFDVIFMDISMPHLDGVAATQIIRGSDGPCRDVPIVAMTAHALQEETDRFLRSGMQQVLQKPITADHLRRVLDGAHVVQSDPRPVEAPALINRSVLAAMTADLGPAKATGLMRSFVAETADAVRLIVARVALSGPSSDVLHDIHKLDGSSALFGAAAMQRALFDIETLWKQGKSDGVRDKVAKLAALWSETELAYRDVSDLAQLSSLR